MRALSPLLVVALAVCLGAAIDGVVKHVAVQVSVVTLLAWRFLFGAGYSLAIFKAAKRPMPSARAMRFHTMRGAIQLVSATAFFWSLTQLALAEATVIGFTAALMVAPIARVVLGEKLTAVSGVAALIGFAGAVLAISGETSGAPTDGDRVLGAAACFLAAGLYALTLVLLRLRTREEDTLTIVMFTNTVPAILLLPVLFTNWPLHSLNLIPVFAGLGVMGLAVWWMMTDGYGRAEAQRLAPLEFTALIWASLIGWIFFKEVPGWQLWVGAAIIIMACLLVAFESRFRTRKDTHLPVSDILD